MPRPGHEMSRLICQESRTSAVSKWSSIARPTTPGYIPLPKLRARPICRRFALPLLTELVEQRLGILQVGRVKTLGEPAVERREDVVCLGASTLVPPQTGEARCSA